ncbi:MAG TPA: 50S ribosomal protein L35 [Candidatus Desulfofervidus auxilii]|uniref:Large ribosomal subunit protein bL35 n=1 Tax=Desulfofervidus auxilii TaxID=1621989 RepID=A0A7C0U1G6_DESA2|nr:50S ribosomal protein L35 [Candidatus Desulfofervidus auxilii]
MPKIKTNRSAAKRFKITAKGKIRRGQGWHSHLLRKKSAKRKRRLRHFALVHKADLERVKRMLPNAF